jgi:uncharacterized protein
MKIPSILILLAVSTFCLSTSAAPPSDKSINQLLQLTKIDKQVDAIAGQMEGMMRAGIQKSTQGKTLNAEEQAVLTRQQARMAAVMKEELNWEKMKVQYAQVYRDMFSQEEIDALIAFYQTPTGRSFVNKQPELMKRTMAVMQQHLTPVMQRIQKMSEETSAALKKAKGENPPAPKAK